jgi:hypothetical protein
MICDEGLNVGAVVFDVEFEGVATDGIDVELPEAGSAVGAVVLFGTVKVVGATVVFVTFVGPDGALDIDGALDTEGAVELDETPDGADVTDGAVVVAFDELEGLLESVGAVVAFFDDGMSDSLLVTVGAGVAAEAGATEGVSAEAGATDGVAAEAGATDGAAAEAGATERELGSALG